MNPNISLPQLPANLDPALRDYLFAWQKLITSKQLDDYSANKSVDTRLTKIESMYGIGAIYISVNNVNPSTWMTGTTWEAYGQGRTLIGAGTGTDSRSESKTFTVGQTGGEYNHLLTPAETALREHQHAMGASIQWPENATGETFYGWNVQWPALSVKSVTDGLYGGAQNATTAHNNLQPYLTVYMWKRTA